MVSRREAIASSHRAMFAAWSGVLGAILILFCAFRVAASEPASPVGLGADQTPSVRISLSDRRATLFVGETAVKCYPVAIGRPGWETPVGHFKVLAMQRDPVWKHPLTGRIVPAGAPGNPMGKYWIQFSADALGCIGIHGTPEPETVGKAASHGCIRMYPSDVEELFSQVRVGTPVTVTR